MNECLICLMKLYIDMLTNWDMVGVLTDFLHILLEQLS